MAEQAVDEKIQDARWVLIQKKTFTRWANTYLKERMLKVDDLQTDLHDGISLINLLEIISSKSLGRYNKTPKIRSQLLENCNAALNFLKSENIKLVNIGGEDIVDGKLKLILGMIWTIICRYQIHIEEGKSARSDLLKWVRSKIPEYNIMNFSNDWNDGKAVCALGEALVPGLCPGHRDLDANNPLYNARLGEDNAEREMGIPQILSPEDMINPDVDELSVMTYISYFRDWEANNGKKKRDEEMERIAVPSKCKAYGPGLERAETFIQTEFTIEAINAKGTRVPHGGDPFVVSIKGPKGVEIHHNIVDHQDGLYTVTYTPNEIGKHLIAVTLTEKHIERSPFSVPVIRSGPDSSKCKAYGPGIEPGNVAGAETHFTIQANNRLGEPVKDGGDKFDVKIKGPFDVEILPEIKDNKDGTYTVKYKPMDNGNHVVTVAHNNTPIPQSPINVLVEKNPNDADAQYCDAYGPGLEGGNTSEPATFTVEAKNSKGERVKASGIPVDAEVYNADGAEIPVKIVDNHDGTFSVSYQPTDDGKHEVHVMLRHKQQPVYYEHIAKSPYFVGIEAGADANKTIAFGPGLEDNKVSDQLPTTFTIQAKDRNGNNLKKGGDPFDVKIQGPNGPVPANIKDNGDGTYTVDYKPNDAGKHRVDVTLKGQPINKSPYFVNVKEGADNEHSIIDSYSFVIQARTKKNKDKKEGGDKFEVTIKTNTETTIHAEVKDIGNGTYVVTYKLPNPGDYVIAVNLNGQPLKHYEKGIKMTY